MRLPISKYILGSIQAQSPAKEIDKTFGTLGPYVYSKFRIQIVRQAPDVIVAYDYLSAPDLINPAKIFFTFCDLN